MPISLADDPRFLQMVQAADALTRPGQPYEMRDETVLGQRLAVLARRPRSLRQVLVDGCAAHGHDDCYVFNDGRRFDFAQLRDLVASVATSLQDRYGITPGDRVGICAANCPEWLLTFWAVASLNAVVVAMNGWWTGVEMRNALALTEPSVLLVDEKRLARLEGEASVPVVVIERDFAPLMDRVDAPLPDPLIAEDDPFMLIFTSGTTGRPKAATLSHRSVIGYVQLQLFIQDRSMLVAGRTSTGAPPPVRLSPFPLFHVSGMGTAISTVLTGGKTVWPIGRFDPARVVAVTLQENVAMWSGGTTHIARLLDSPEIDAVPPTQILSIGVGGSATTPDILRRVAARFPHLDGSVSTGYGSTETGGIASWAPNWMLRAVPGCVGPLLPTIEARITDDQGVVLADGEEGNIEIRNPHTMLGYWRNDAANEETILPGRWIASGDFGRLEDGILFIASRRRDLIIRGGENIYPFEVEDRLEAHPDIIEAAVFGVDDSTHGQIVKAVVVASAGVELDPAALRAFCAETLSSYKVPAIFEILTTPLPRNATGKVMKHVLAGTATSAFVDEEA
jgi:acyl-CoA synthetase (AMP-forming)/AMP-acid ligase II